MSVFLKWQNASNTFSYISLVICSEVSDYLRIKLIVYNIVIPSKIRT